MPVLMIALMALGVFGLIGIMLFVAESMERRQQEKDGAHSQANGATVGGK